MAQAISAPVAGAAATSALPDISVKVQSFAYTAYGEQMGGVKVNGFTYNAEAYDAATGMLNLRARQYEPAVGRFGQKDIVRGWITSPILLNRYLYVKNSPIAFEDGTGEFLNAIVNGIKTIKNVAKEIKSIIKTGKTTKGQSAQQIMNRLLTSAYDNIKSNSKLTEEMNLYINKKQKELNDLGTLNTKNIGAANEILMSMCSVLIERKMYDSDYFDTYLGSGNYLDRETWGALPRNDDNMNAIDGSVSNYYNIVVIHHTDGPQDASPIEVQKEHLDKKLSDIGYHYIIDSDGVVYEGRELQFIGAHVTGGNSGKIGIVLTGNFQSGQDIWSSIKNFVQGAMPTQPTSAQIDSLKNLISALDSAYGIEFVGGHRDYVSVGMAEQGTSCPGDSLYEILVEESIIK